MVSVRAIYRAGHLELLDPVDLTEGQQVNVTILDERAAIQAALGDLIVAPDTAHTDEVDEAALLRQLDEDTAGITLSDVIIDERQSGP